MTKLMSLAVAGLVFCTAMLGVVIGIIIYIIGDASAATSYLTSSSLWLCVIITVVGFTLIGSFMDGFLMKLAGIITMRVRLRYAVAYALLTTIMPLLFFLPLTLHIRPFWPVLLTIAIGSLSGFIAGYARGLVMDLWSKNFETRRPFS